MRKSTTSLCESEVEQFLTQGYLVLHDCFSREAAAQWTSLAWQRLGLDPKAPQTWQPSRIHLPALHRREWKEFAPHAWNVACDLLGGEARVKQPCTLGDSFIINFNDGDDRPWQAPSALSPGWHKDGDWFLHFLDSPEQGLLTLVIWSDIASQGGGTFVACDSVPVIARLLAAHPEGIRPGDFDFPALAAQCRDFVEITGRVGDVVFLHPFILHASSQNLSGKPRFLTNPCIQLNAPMQLHRENPDDYSLTERAILLGLGVPHLDFTPSVPRERIVPERERIQARMLEEEKARLATSAS